MKLYALVTITDNKRKFNLHNGLFYSHWDSRCVGIYEHLQNALFDVEQNTFDIHEEGEYPFAVVESLESDVMYGLGEGEDKQIWFEWKNGGYRHCVKPEKFESICTFWG